MFKLNYEDRFATYEIRVRFSFPDKRKPIKKQRKTFCFITVSNPKDEEKYLFTGKAYVNITYGDIFNKHLGRIHSLTNLLKSSEDFFDRGMRTSIWEAFWEWNRLGRK